MKTWQVVDVMTTPVVSVRPDTGYQRVADLLVPHSISAVPVVDADGKVLGIPAVVDVVDRLRAAFDDSVAGNSAWNHGPSLQLRAAHGELAMIGTTRPRNHRRRRAGLPRPARGMAGRDGCLCAMRIGCSARVGTGLPGW